MSKLAGNPKDKFARVAALLSVEIETRLRHHLAPSS